MNTAGQAFLNAVAENKVTFDVCELSSELQNIKRTNKDSASPSEVLFAKLVAGKSNVDVSIKIFATHTDDPKLQKDISGLKYEARLYRYITDKIINTGICPNFVNFIGYGECSQENVYKILGEETQELYESMKSQKKYGKTAFINPTFSILLTEKVGCGMAFGVSEPAVKVFPLANGIRNDHDLRCVFFQIIYALGCLEKFQINHNDLHPWNILVAEFKEEIHFKYKIVAGNQTKNFHFQTKFVPYIFDFDLAQCEVLGPNPNLEGKEMYPKKFTPERDLYILLCYFKFDYLDDLLKNYRMNFFQELHAQEYLTVLDPEKIRAECPTITLTGVNFYMIAHKDFAKVMGYEMENKFYPDPIFVYIDANTPKIAEVKPWFLIGQETAVQLKEGKLGEKHVDEENLTFFVLSVKQFEEALGYSVPFDFLSNVYFNMYRAKDVNGNLVRVARFYRPYECRPLLYPKNKIGIIEILMGKTFRKLEDFSSGHIYTLDMTK